MGRIYFKELPLFHLYDGDLTGSQKLSRAKKTEAQALDNVWLELPWWYEQHRTFLLASIIEAWGAFLKIIDEMTDE